LISCLFAQLKKVKGRCTETPGETTFGLLFPIFGKLTVGVQIWWGSEILRRNLLLWGIHKKRPFFDFKPLDDDQHGNWHQYLDYVEKNGDFGWYYLSYISMKWDKLHLLCYHISSCP
jgi:hypothetical protein